MFPAGRDVKSPSSEGKEGMKRIAVIDGMGGGIGAQIVVQLKTEIADRAEIIALGSNATATDRMIKAGAARGATGENAVRVSVGTADFVLGPIGIVIPDAMMGEITPGIAQAVFGSRAEKFLIPLVQQHFTIVGFEMKPVGVLIAQAAGLVKRRLDEGAGTPEQ
jgi:hypothetical protein